MAKPGRPMGPILVAVLDRIRERHMTAREVAKELQLSIEAAKIACTRLRESQMIYVHKKIRIDGVNKPVSVYGACFETKNSPAMMAANIFANQTK